MRQPVTNVNAPRRSARRRRTLLSETEWRGIALELAISPREFEIVRQIFDCRTEAAMARELKISVHTVHAHVKRLYRKLDVRDHAELLVHVFETYLRLKAAANLVAADPARPAATPDGAVALR